jgi:hypothetical protein
MMSYPAFKFDHLHIISNDPEASANWYVEMFGATSGQLQDKGGQRALGGSASTALEDQRINERRDRQNRGRLGRSHGLISGRWSSSQIQGLHNPHGTQLRTRLVQRSRPALTARL